eukprot:TRINITY_DN44899_c0_g1_i1.p1 TRINITY_DN44899_c0_g1~~TRINITY_DN44899_c0_g1_i1.p1  ORF type:complete len:217 (-),score=25.84 TRINITY_DN44899_c0_g1_i1:553-1203(-)
MSSLASKIRNTRPQPSTGNLSSRELSSWNGDQDADSGSSSSEDDSGCFARCVRPKVAAAGGVRKPQVPAQMKDIAWPQHLQQTDAEVAAMERSECDEKVLAWWSRTSGLHTVEQWCHDYNDHPAGWGALLMIHGIPEITGRLRSKVESYAIYSALFLSGALASAVSPPSGVVDCGEDTTPRPSAKLPSLWVWHWISLRCSPSCRCTWARRLWCLSC